MPDSYSLGVLATVATIVLLLRLGQAMYVVGSVRSKNAAASAMRLIMDLAVVTLALWAVGAVFVPAGRSTDFLTFSHFFGISNSSQIAFRLLPTLIIATGAVHGALAERARLLPILIVSALLAAIVVPVINAVSVVLSQKTGLVIIDHGVGLGSVVGGAIALVGTLLVGPRKGKFNRDLSCNFIPGHNISFQLFGLLVLTFGFAVAGSGAALLGACAAAVAGAGFGWQRFGKPDTGLTTVAILTGVVAAGTAGGPTWGAVLVGLIAGAVSPWLVIFIETRLRMDDVTGSIPTYLFGGLLGLIAAGLLRPGATAGQRFGSLTANLLLGIAVAAVVAGVAWLVFNLCRQRGALRVSEDAEFDGADLTELDLNAYPDFQQTTIKSYHLREL